MSDAVVRDTGRLPADAAQTSLDDLAACPELATQLGRQAVLALHARAVRALAALEGPLLAHVAAVAESATSVSSTSSSMQLLTVAEAARRMGFARSYVYELARRGELTVVRRGKYVRVTRPAIDAWIAAHEG